MNQTTELRPVRPEDLFRLQFLQGAKLSPNGKTIVYAVSHVESEKATATKQTVEETEHVALWLLSVETGKTRQLTAGLARDAAPQWSPAGKQIAFLSTRVGNRKSI
jgi:Tol biopolymer transport system component